MVTVVISETTYVYCLLPFPLQKKKVLLVLVASKNSLEERLSEPETSILRTLLHSRMEIIYIQSEFKQDVIIYDVRSALGKHTAADRRHVASHG